MVTWRGDSWSLYFVYVKLLEKKWSHRITAMFDSLDFFLYSQFLKRRARAKFYLCQRRQSWVIFKSGYLTRLPYITCMQTYMAFTVRPLEFACFTTRKRKEEKNRKHLPFFLLNEFIGLSETLVLLAELKIPKWWWLAVQRPSRWFSWMGCL